MKPDQIAAFVFGFIFVAIMLIVGIAIPNPTSSQLFIFRTVLSLAAGGIGAVIPGFLDVKISVYVRAGGAMALFALIYMVNPPLLVAGSPQFQTAMWRGDQALSESNYPAARQFYKEAARLDPGNWKPFDQLGRVESRDGNFALSLHDFKTAVGKKGRPDGSILYGIAEAEDALQQPEEEKKYLIEARKRLAPNSQLLPDVTFDLGLVNLELWLTNGIPKETEEYRQSDLAFQRFLEEGGQPAQWALYCRACLRAGRAEDPSLSDAARRRFSAQANDGLEKAVAALSQYQSDKAPYQEQLMRILLTTPSHRRHRPGEAPACPPLLRSWNRAHGSVNSLLAKMSTD